MGLKSKINKMKSFLFDEVDDEKQTKKSIKNKLEKKEPKRIKEDDYKEKKEDVIEELFLDEPVKEEKKEEVYSRSERPKFNFQEFDDDDFMVTKKKPEPLIKKEPKVEPKRALYQGSKIKNENKKFTPSPIISPIYGLLDDEGNMVKEKKIKDRKEDVTFDSVRKKAYGVIDDELEDTIDDLKTKTIEQAEKEMEEKLSRQKKKIEEKKLQKIEVSDEEDDDDDMILPNISFKEIDVDKEASSKKKNSSKKVVKKLVEDDDDDDTKEQDLFNLIDTMYQKEGNDE